MRLDDSVGSIVRTAAILMVGFVVGWSIIDYLDRHELSSQSAIAFFATLIVSPILAGAMSRARWRRQQLRWPQIIGHAFASAVCVTLAVCAIYPTSWVMLVKISPVLTGLVILGVVVGNPFRGFATQPRGTLGIILFALRIVVILFLLLAYLFGWMKDEKPHRTISFFDSPEMGTTMPTELSV